MHVMYLKFLSSLRNLFNKYFLHQLQEIPRPIGNTLQYIHRIEHNWYTTNFSLTKNLGQSNNKNLAK